MSGNQQNIGVLQEIYRFRFHLILNVGKFRNRGNESFLKTGKPAYLELKDHYESKLFLHGDNHKGVDWPNEKDANTRYRVMRELLKFVEKENNEPLTLLDLGCGLSHQYQYFLDTGLDLKYTGVDISHEFIKRSKDKYPGNHYVHADILKDDSGIPESDYVLANGLFTEKLSMDFDEMWRWVQSMLIAISKKTRVGFACNFMSTNVDWEREDLFHLSIDELVKFVSAQISREITVRNDYGLFEYTVYVAID